MRCGGSRGEQRVGERGERVERLRTRHGELSTRGGRLGGYVRVCRGRKTRALRGWGHFYINFINTFYGTYEIRSQTRGVVSGQGH